MARMEDSFRKGIKDSSHLLLTVVHCLAQTQHQPTLVRQMLQFDAPNQAHWAALQVFEQSPRNQTLSVW
jgi:hypothetical protein